VQKIKNFILYRSDEILVGIFVSVVQVAYFGNYTIITSKLNFLVNILSDGMNAGVGNLVAEGNDQNTMKVFWELTAIRFFITGAVVFGLLLFLQSFVVCWFGAQYRLSNLIVYLLVFNRFFTPEYLQNTTVAANETYSLLSSTVTGQINSWLSRLTDVVSVGFNFRTDGEGANSSQEYETQFRIQPVNRLSINGNVGYRYNDLSNRPFFGDVDIEYELTPDGKLRARAFTHTVDKYSLKQASTVQGVGFIFRHDFNAGDAKRQREARKQKKETQQNDK
jgi:hypothetical protein